MLWPGIFIYPYRLHNSPVCRVTRGVTSDWVVLFMELPDYAIEV